MRRNRKPITETATFICPRCGYKQKGYFNTCPVTGCADARMREFVAAARATLALVGKP